MDHNSSQQSLFSESGIRKIDFPLFEGEIHRSAFSDSEGTELLTLLLSEIDWNQEQIKMFGEFINVPRLTAWHGDTDKPYTYSGITMTPTPWTNTLLNIKKRAEHLAGTSFNSVLLNQYRDGNDGVSWHADDEPELGESPTICSVSLGVSRKFQLRRKGESRSATSIDLTSGDVLIMRGKTQKYWEHQVPKSKSQKSMGIRVNLTFRTIVS